MKKRKKISKMKQNQTASLIPLNEECKYSFWDLYKAAFRLEASEKVKNTFYNLSQEMKNSTVKKWAEKAHWLVEDRIGSDGITYTAFSQPTSQVR